MATIIFERSPRGEGGVGELYLFLPMDTCFEGRG